MKFAFLAILLIAVDAYGDELQLGFYPAFSEDSQFSAAPIFEISKKADRVIWHDYKKSFDLGLGKETESVRSPIYLTFDEIRSFLEGERHKDCIVVWFDKTVMWNEKAFIADRANEVIKQMQEVGFRRVVILGAHGSGVHYVADTKLNEKKAEQGGAANSAKPGG